MTETLEQGLSRLQGRAVRIRELRRVPCATASSFRAERLGVTLDSGESLRVFFKNMHPDDLLAKARAVRGFDLEPSRREVRVYESILSPERFGTLVLYATRWEPEQGRVWIFLEDAGRGLLHNTRDLALWSSAARWAARFHAGTLDVPEDRGGFLPSLDVAHYRQVGARVRNLLPQLESRERELVDRGLAILDERLAWLCDLPRCVIHGQFFGRNIVLRSASDLVVIDWETAARGPGLFDLVSLTSGSWTDSERRTMWAAYRDAYDQATGQAPPWEEFCAGLASVAVFHALTWLAWWGEHRHLSRAFSRFLRELELVLTPATGVRVWR